MLALFVGASTHAAECLTNGMLQLSFASADQGFGVESVSCRREGAPETWAGRPRPATQGTPETWAGRPRPATQGTPETWAGRPRPATQGAPEMFAGRPRPATFWTLRFRAGASNAHSEILLNNRSACRARRMERSADGGATFIWEGLDLGAEKAVVTVRARVAFPQPGESAWTLDVQNASAIYGLFETRYPEIRRFVSEGDDLLLPRKDLGARLIRKAKLDKSHAFGCMGYCPMMLATFDGERGLYFAAHDSQSRIKRLTLAKSGDVAFVTPTENGGLPRRAAEGPRYAVTLAALEGDWWAAAKRYRAWALTTPWTAKGPIVTRADYPRRLAEIPLWINTHAYPAEASNTLARAAALFPGVPIGLHWHLWQHSGHDVNYPEYFPEQPGTREVLSACRAFGTEPMPYTNGRLWSTNLVSYALARPFALHRADGNPIVEQYGTLTPPMSPMCPATAMWDATLNDFATRILGLGAGSLFLDQIGACAGQACYCADHGHPVGGGTWYFDGYQAILAKTHAAYAAKGAFLTTEGSGEQWMNVIDGYLNVTQRGPDDVPFFHAVYSGYTTYFCSPENDRDDADSFWAAQARELVWGQSLGWYHPAILEDAEKCELLRKLIAFRQNNLDCLAYGTMEDAVRLRGTVPNSKGSVPGSVGTVSNAVNTSMPSHVGRASSPCVMEDVSFHLPGRGRPGHGKSVPKFADLGSVPGQSVTWLGRKAFFLWTVKDAPLSPTVTGVLPAVEGIVWRSAKTGRRAAILANLSPCEQTIRFAFGGEEPARGRAGNVGRASSPCLLEGSCALMRKGEDALATQEASTAERTCILAPRELLRLDD